MANGDQSVEVGGKLPVKIKGVIGILGSIIIGLCLAIAWLINFSLGSWGSPFDIQTTMTEHNKESKENTYILWVCLNQATMEQCKDINIRMPDSLRKKQRQE